MSIFDNGSWVKPNLCFGGSERKSSVSTESKIDLAADIVPLIGPQLVLDPNPSIQKM